jgi:hypothetical protein
MVVQLLRDHPGTITLIAAASALFGATVAAIAAHLVHRVRTKLLSAEIARLKEQRGRRIEEFSRLAPGLERRAPGATRPSVGGEADVTDRIRIDRSD